MRIGVVLFQYVSGKVGGTGEMIEQGLPRILQRLSPDDRMLLFGSCENLTPLRKPLSDHRAEFFEIEMSSRKRALLRVLDLFAAGMGTTNIIGQIRLARPDVVWSPQQSLFPLGIGCPNVVTCVDLQHQHLPKNFPILERWGRYLKDRQMVRFADRIACISETTRRDLLACHGGDASKVGTVHLGGGGGFFEGTPSLTEGLNGDYLYFPANSYPHKNHIRLIRSFREWKRLHPSSEMRLVMTGQVYPHLHKELAASKTFGGIEHLGFVPSEKKEQLMRNCLGVIFPSLFEGFGIPVIEAMRYGKPVLCHRLDVFEELVGEAVTYCDARTEEGILKGLEEWLGSEKTFQLDRSRYAEIVERYTWDRFADQMISEFRTTAKGGKSKEQM